MNTTNPTLDSVFATSAIGGEIREAYLRGKMSGTFSLPEGVWRRIARAPKDTVRGYREYARFLDFVEGENPTADWEGFVIHPINECLEPFYAITHTTPENGEVARYKCNFSAPYFDNLPGYNGTLDTIVRLHADGSMEERTWPYQMQWLPLFAGGRLAEELMEFRTK